jgi:hypothetical protein
MLSFSWFSNLVELGGRAFHKPKLLSTVSRAACLKQNLLNHTAPATLTFCTVNLLFASRFELRGATGDGKAKVLDEKQTSVFKRVLNAEYNLKLKTSRTILSEINKRYPCMPFPLRRLLERGSTSKLGLMECLQHGLLQSYPVLYEKEGVMVAQVKGTVLLLPNGSDWITSRQMQAVQCNVEILVCLPFHVWCLASALHLMSDPKIAFAFFCAVFCSRF